MSHQKQLRLLEQKRDSIKLRSLKHKSHLKIVKEINLFIVELDRLANESPATK